MKSRWFVYYLPVLFIWLCPLLLSFSTTCIAQDAKLKPGTDTAKIDHLLDVAHRKANVDSAIYLYNEQLRISIAANYTFGIIQSYSGIGFKYMMKGELNEAIDYYTKEVAYCVDPNDKVKAYCDLGTAYIYKCDYIPAGDSYYAALRVQQKSNVHNKYSVRIYKGLATINERLQQRDKQLYYLNLADKEARQLTLDYELGEIIICKSAYYTELKKTDSSNACLYEALDISKKGGYTEWLGLIYFDLGINAIDKDQNEKAISCFDSSITFAKNRYNYYYVYIPAAAGIGEALFNLKKYKQAIAILLPALEAANKINFKNNAVDIYDVLKNSYKATGQYKNALDCMDSISVLKDSSTSAEKAAAINQMEIKYKTAEKDKQLTQNQLLIAQQGNKITRKNTLIAATAGGVLLLLIISTGVYRNSRQKQRLQAGQIKSLEQQNKILEQENKIGILKAAVQGEDNERSRISRELHDGIGGMLSAAIIRLSALHNEDEAITKIPSYNEAMGILSEMGDEIRKTAHNLMPEVLLKQNLPEAIRTFCNNIQDSNFLQVDYQYYGSFDGLSENFKLNVYRMVQELLKNIIQHAHATHALVQLQENENMLAITVEDNGVGFNVNEPKKGIGLHNLRTRVSSLDGYLTIRSIPNKGTSVFIELPTPGPAAVGSAQLPDISG